MNLVGETLTPLVCLTSSVNTFSRDRKSWSRLKGTLDELIAARQKVAAVAEAVGYPL